MVSTIILATEDPETVTKMVDLNTKKPKTGTNSCKDAKNKLPLKNSDCIVDGSAGTVPPQSGANVTKGYVGEYPQDTPDPITEPYFKKGLCPVNVHWHLGAEHTSYGEYDEENGTGPTDVAKRRQLAGKVRKGGQCMYYDKDVEMYTKPYDWKHCVGMEVGQTYEVHWPHSVHGACGTPDQYQEPFYDGVFCKLTALDIPLTEQIGVQGQVFVIVNDDSYYYPDMIKGMIVDGDMGKDMAYYAGSTTGTSRDNKVCSNYGPITWQVDRKCHKISASSFDKMCADMKSQRDDMAGDLYAHGSRIVVADELASKQAP